MKVCAALCCASECLSHVSVYNKQTVNWIQLHSRQNNWLNGNWIHVYVADEWSDSVFVLLVCMVSHRGENIHTQFEAFFYFIWTDHVTVCTENENQTNKQSLCYRNRFLTWLTHVRTKSTVYTSRCASSQSSKLRHFNLSAALHERWCGLLHTVCLLCVFHTVRYDTIRYYYSTYTVLSTLHFVIALVLSATFRSYGIVFDVHNIPFRNAIRNPIQCMHNVYTIWRSVRKNKIHRFKQNFCYHHSQCSRSHPEKKEESFSNDEFVCAVTFPNGAAHKF